MHYRFSKTFINHYGKVVSLHLCSFLEKCQKDKCFRNGVLKKEKFLLSKNGKYGFYLRRNGNLVLTCGGRPIWTSLTINDTVDYLHFNKKGTSLVLRGKSLIFLETCPYKFLINIHQFSFIEKNDMLIYFKIRLLFSLLY